MKRFMWLIRIGVVWSVCVGLAHAQILELLPTGTAEGMRIRLRDVVRQASTLPAGWGDREIAEAPVPGEARVLPLPDIATALHGYEDMRSLVLRGPPEIRITSRSQAVALDALDSALQTYLMKQPEWEGKRFKICPERAVMPPAPTGQLTVRVEGLREGPNAGQIFADMDVRVDGKPIAGSERLSFALIELRPFWAVTRPLARGDVLGSEDVEERWAEIGEASRYYPASDPVVGMEARRNLRTGQMLAVGSLAAPLYARRGEILRVVSKRGGLVVTLRARALTDGRRAERIACVNERSGRRMYVRLVATREAILEDTEDVRT